MAQVLQSAFMHPNQFAESVPSGSNGMQMQSNFMSQNMLTNQSLQTQPASIPPPGTIPLSTLIEFVVHKTYHDITVMAEVLPSKTDMERKISIVQFATRTRQLFIRLLSLVKWATSVGKVVKCSEISSFLDRQAMLFVDTADKLHILANQLVVQARLPNFSVPAAVDVLTTGTYPRLPTCIRRKIVPPDPILPKEKKATLKRIEQIILYRLVTEIIPLQVADLKVEKGVVYLHVPGEFRAAVTLMGDGSDIPWRLLRLEFLVEDREVGSGKSLVHNMQVNYLHELVQSRLFANDKPLVDMFNLLHCFCLSLKLEVLQAQADRLMKVRWGMFIQIDEYLPGQKLVLSYWRANPYKKQIKPLNISIHQSPVDGSKPLQVVHNPSLPFDDVELVESASHIKHLSLERLLNQTICIRSYHMLCELKQMLQKHIRSDPSFFAKDMHGQSSVLLVPLVEPWKDRDCLSIYVDPQTGMFVPSLHNIDEFRIEKMEKEINENVLTLLTWITMLRNLISKEKCKNSLTHLPVVCLDRLLLVNEATHPISRLSENKLFVKINRYPLYYLIVAIESSPDMPTKVLYKYYLLKTTTDPASDEMKKSKSESGRGVFDLIKPNVDSVKNSFDMKKAEGGVSARELYATSFVQLDNKFTDISLAPCLTKRRKKDDEHLDDGDENIKELVRVTSVWSSRIPFVSLLESLSAAGLQHQGVQDEGPDVGVVCRLVRIPDVKGVQPEVNALLQDAVLQCSFRCQERASKFWSVELVMKAPPLKATLPRHQESSLKVSFHYEVTKHSNPAVPHSNPVKSFLSDWSAMARLYGPFYIYSKQLQHPACNLASSTSLHFFNYKTIIVKYGKDLQLFVSINWSQDKKFQLHFGRCDTGPSSNAHCLTRHYLNEMFNLNPDISKLMHVLNETSRPVQAISRLPSTPVIGVGGKSNLCEEVFSIVAQGPAHLRVFFMSAFCLDVYCRGDEMVAIRDASFSQFDFSKIKTNMVPVPGLATFLAQFRDAKDVRHRSNEEKDNPPSPAPLQPNQPGTSSYGLNEIAPAHWAGATCTLLSHASLETLCTPLTHVNRQIHSQAFTPCPLEQFLGATLVRRHMEKCMRATPGITPIAMANNTDGPDGSLASAFATASLQFLCRLHPQNFRQLILKIQPVPMAQSFEWIAQEFEVLERYFELRVATSPYRLNVMKSFFMIISAQTRLLRDLIQVMRMELAGRSVSANAKWTVSICLTSPPRIAVMQCGVPSIIIKEKVLLFIQLTQVPGPGTSSQLATIVVPLLLEPSKATVTVALQASPMHQVMQQVSALLSRVPADNRDAPFSTAARVLVENLVLQ